MKGIRKLSTGKKFLMSLLATTVSIVLTFGTTAIIDRKKQRAEKREMVLIVSILDLKIFSVVVV